MDQAFAVRQGLERYLSKGKDVFFAFMDLKMLMVRLIGTFCGRSKSIWS